MAISAISESLQRIWNESQAVWRKSLFDETEAAKIVINCSELIKAIQVETMTDEQVDQSEVSEEKAVLFAITLDILSQDKIFQNVAINFLWTSIQETACYALYLTLKHKVQGEIYIGLSLQEEEVLLDILIRTSEQLLGMRENLKSRKLVEIMRFIIQKQHPDLESNSEKISKMSPALQQTLLHSLVVSTIQSLEDIDKKDRQTLSPAIVASKMIFSILRDHCAVRFSSLKLKMCKTWINFSISSVKPNLGTLLEKDVRKFALFAADSLKNSTEMTTEEISLFRKCMMFNCNSFFREQLWEKCFKNCTSLVKTNMSTDQTHVLLLESLYRKVQENYAESDFEEAYVCFENVSTFLLGRNPPSISAICLVIEMVSNVTRKLLELKPLSQFCEKVWAWCLNILQRIKQLASNLDDHEQLARSALACALHLKKRDSISSCIQGLIKAHNSNPNSISIKGLQKVVQLLVSHSILAEHRDIHESLTFLKYAQQFCKDDPPLKSKVVRNIVRLLLRIDPPNITEAEKLIDEEHCFELSHGTASRSTILFKMKISLIRGLHEEALRLIKFLLSEDQPILRTEADVEMIASMLEMDLKKQLPDVGFIGKLNMWAGLFRELKFSSSSICADGLRLLIFQHISFIFNSIFQCKVTSLEIDTHISQYCFCFDLFLKSLAELPHVHVLGSNPSIAKNLKAIAHQCIYLPLRLETNMNAVDANSIADLQIRGHELFSCIFNAPFINTTPDLELLCGIKLSLDIFFLTQNPKVHKNSFAHSQAVISAAAHPATDRHVSFIQALTKSLSIAKENFTKILESHPKVSSALPDVAATLARTCTVVSDTNFVELAGCLTNFCLNHLAKSGDRIEKKYVSICCKSFEKIFANSLSRDCFGVRSCSILLLQMILENCTQSCTNKMPLLLVLQSAINGLHHMLLAEDIIMDAFTEAARLLAAIDVATRGPPAKFLTCIAYNDAVLLCNTQELVAAEKILAAAMTLSKYLSPEENYVARRVEQAYNTTIENLASRS